MQNINGRVLAILAARGVSATDYQLREDADGKGPYIAAWNVATLGPKPTDTELTAVLGTDAQAAEKAAAADREGLQPIAQAMILFYLRDKLGRNPTNAERQAATAAYRQAYRDVT